jgi:hypothetical protein
VNEHARHEPGELEAPDAIGRHVGQQAACQHDDGQVRREPAQHLVREVGEGQRGRATEDVARIAEQRLVVAVPIRVRRWNSGLDVFRDVDAVAAGT